MNTGAREDFFSAVGDSVVEDPKYMDPLSRAKHPVANVRKVSTRCVAYATHLAHMG